jgi:hypothetical protein
MSVVRHRSTVWSYERPERAVEPKPKAAFGGAVVGTRKPTTDDAPRSRHAWQIIAALKEYDCGLTSIDVADLLQIEQGHAHQLLLTMRARGEVDYVGRVELPSAGTKPRRLIVWKVNPRRVP